MKRVLTTLAATAAIALSGVASYLARAGNESATGDYVRSNGSRMTINAIKHKNGRVTGWMYFQSPAGQTILVAVDTLIVIENSAYIQGIVVESPQNLSLIGRRSYHRVVDNGERAGSEPDRAATFANPATLPADPFALLSATSAILEGNIQVRQG